MNRKDFIRLLTLLPISGSAMKLNTLEKMVNTFSITERMPVLFLGHGNPMNAIEKNEFTNGFKVAAGKFRKPKAIICISAHWETNGTFITAMEKPKTIHDFGGFPQALFDVQYPSPGDPQLASETRKMISSVNVKPDYDWGLDHGCWSVLKNMYPEADIPVLQLSLDYTKGPQYHYELAKELSSLRNKGVLIVGSGNIVHNLRMIQWNDHKGADWAIEANDKIKSLILNGDHNKLINYKSLGKEVQLAVPSPDHYLPLLYTLGLKDAFEKVTFFNDKTELGSISMTSVFIS